MKLIEWFLEWRGLIKNKRLKWLLGDVMRALANYVPLFKLSPSPVNTIASEFTEDAMEDESRLPLFARYQAYFVLIFAALKCEKDVSWPPCLTAIIRELAERSMQILTALKTQRKKTNDGKLRRLSEEEVALFSDPNRSGISTYLTPIHARSRYDFYSESDKYKAKKFCSFLASCV